MSSEKDQQHPLYKSDRNILNNLLVSEPTDYNLAELARLKIRYHGFPGARDIQADLDKVLQTWGLNETSLFARTRQIHAGTPIYRGRANRGETEDWS
ncbi:DUF3288 family protein [Aliterella atlantica]|uniref:DUF3288 domain-containing protein n=1 Tax=Aliterella atlantica CENA595 TaxID=1618023 RepID=A0A0D8ZSZ3_9CYAN|nr:DUF3288 family protein [Aliterella atlantica]KJH70346.1 hypothetical protein UH38_18760 [Aliterella atlantica CENA595]